MTRVAMLAAVCAALGYISLETGNFKITFESLPVLLSGMMFGAIDGMLVGGIGTFIYQILRYGITATTFLWIAPYVLCGFFTGAVMRKLAARTEPKRIMFIVVSAELLIFVLNTCALYVDSIIYGYYSAVFIFGTIPLRIAFCVVKSVIFGILLPILLKGLKTVSAAEYR